MNSPRTPNTACYSITAEKARDIRARAWAFIFQCWQEKQEGGPPTAPDDAMKGSKHDRATEDYTESS